MNKSNLLAKRIFFWSAVYGIVVLFPLYFLEASLGQAFPPAGNKPEQYYGFIGVALAWQLAFFIISSDVHRYRKLILPAIAEKFLSAGAVIVLYFLDRVALETLAPSIIDLVIGGLFVLAYRHSAPGLDQATNSPQNDA